jgi:hypothetical protein
VRRSGDDRDRLVEELRDRVRSLERRLDEAEASRRRADGMIERLTQEQHESSASPSVWRESVEEGGKETARRLVGGIAALVVGAASFPASLISYFNNATILTVLITLLAFFAILTGVVGTYYGVKHTSDVSERARRVMEEANVRAEEANVAAERAAQEAAGEPQEDG